MGAQTVRRGVDRHDARPAARWAVQARQGTQPGCRVPGYSSWQCSAASRGCLPRPRRAALAAGPARWGARRWCGPCRAPANPWTSSSAAACQTWTRCVGTACWRPCSVLNPPQIHFLTEAVRPAPVPWHMHLRAALTFAFSSSQGMLGMNLCTWPHISSARTQTPQQPHSHSSRAGTPSSLWRLHASPQLMLLPLVTARAHPDGTGGGSCERTAPAAAPRLSACGGAS